MNSIGPARGHEVAQRILAGQGLADAQHTVLQSNLAHHLAQVDAPIVETLEKRGTEAAVGEAYDSPSESFRSVLKAERDLEKPYTDAEVLSRAQTLDTKLRQVVDEHARLNGSYPRQMWVVGSLVHGGFGANSDADVILDGGPSCKTITTLDTHHDIHLQYLKHGEESKQFAFFQGAIAIDPAALHRGDPVLTPLLLKSWPQRLERL